MSDNDQTEGRAPTQAYQEMPPTISNVGTEEEKKKTFSHEMDGLQEAAKELASARDAVTVPQAAPDDPKVRVYQKLGSGEPIASNLTLSAERASDDLKIMRALESAHNPEEVTSGIDKIRADYFNAQAAQQQQPAQPQAQPQQQAQPQPDQQQASPELDPEIAQALNNPKIREALAKEVAQAEAVRQQYQQATWQAAQISAAGLLSNYPELQGLDTSQLPVAIATIAKTNPQRAMEINGALGRTEALYKESLRAQAAEQQIAGARMKAWIAAEDAKFESEIAKTETSESIQKIKQSIPDIAQRHYGISPQQLAHLWNSEPIMRSSAMQLMIAAATKWHIAQDAIKNAAAKDVPPVQRPGIARMPDDQEATHAAMAKFRADPSPETAAKLLMARRARR